MVLISFRVQVLKDHIVCDCFKGFHHNGWHAFLCVWTDLEHDYLDIFMDLF